MSVSFLAIVFITGGSNQICFGNFVFVEFMGAEISKQKEKKMDVTGTFRT